MNDVSVILLAGGIGTRMESETPKQYLLLNDRPVITYSLELFLSLPEVKEVVVVCHPDYRKNFSPDHPRIKFALPGERRQDSVFHGLQVIDRESSLVMIHDSSRPMVSEKIVHRVIEAAREHGAAAAGMPVKFTVKQMDGHNFVTSTPDRSQLWEVQTPQAMMPELLVQGFEKANSLHLTVTDDVSLIELIGHPVKLVEGNYSNLKITTPEDLPVAETLLKHV